MCVILDGDVSLHLINRETKLVEQKIFISEFVGNICLKQRGPVLFVRNEEGVFMVDVDRGLAKQII